MTRVLHVTEAMGGGITTALLSYAKSAPNVEHYLLYCERGTFKTGDELAGFSGVHRLEGGVATLATQIRRFVRSWSPDYLHLHSAWAGLVGRLQLWGGSRPTIVYTPHSYYFERTTAPAPVRKTAWLVERLLSRRTDVSAGVSPNEVQLAEQLGSRAVYIPNEVIDLPRHIVGSWRPSYGAGDVVGVGRLSAQKDPRFFAAVVRAVRRHGVQTRFAWVGDGEPELRRLLIDVGVEVTGWLPRAAVLQRISTAACYLHTAAWEGSPMSVLEANAIGVPVVARSISALTSLGYPRGLTSPEDVAGHLSKMLLEHGSNLTAPPVPTLSQRSALRDLYAMPKQILKDRSYDRY